MPVLINPIRMRHAIFYLVVLFVSCFTAKGQTTITGTVTDSLNNPVPYASVYLSKTTYGVPADNKGVFTLTIDQNGIYELMVSCLGYKSYSQFVAANVNRQIINVKLSGNPVRLKEVSVSSKYRLKQSDFTLFSKLFLGETSNSYVCKIVNKGDLRLFKDVENSALTGFSLNPLIVQNKALGYSVIYNLIDFNYNLKTGSLRFKGDYYFQKLTANSLENKRWAINRLTAYYGSRMHFFRTLFTDSLFRQNFRLFEYNIGKNDKDTISVKPILADALVITKNKNFMSLSSDKPILVNYTDNHPELATGLTGFYAHKEESTIVFSDIINVYPNGYYDNPYSITWGGEMANERIADMLPYDFLPDENMIGNQVQNANISPVERYLLSQNRSNSPDQVFVHLDRNMYNAGDTIRFQAYVRDRFTTDFGSKSVVLYAILYDERKEIADSSRFKINNATSSGWMTIPSTARSGKYHFVAFTGIMQNFDPSEAFRTDIIVRGSGKNIQGLTSSTDPENMELSFLPEGGNLVLGVKQRIGFNATDKKGSPVYIEGLLKNRLGQTLDTIKSGNYGPGSFICTTEPGMYVEITLGPGENKKWQLPTPMSSGICLSVKTIDNRSFNINVESNKLTSDTAIVAGVMNTNLIFLKDLALNKKQNLVINTDELPAGVVLVTLFSKDFHPLAQRLYYVNPDKHLNFIINTGSQVYNPGEETELTISAKDGQGNPSKGIFSISVTDSVSGYNPEIYTPGIESVFNFNPYFQRNLPGKVLASGLENLSDDDRDLMLMVYGWSRISWDFNVKDTTTQNINYDLINIKVHGESKAHTSVKKMDLISIEGPSVIHLLTNLNGEISLPLDSLPGNTRNVRLFPGTREKKMVASANLSIPCNHEYFNNKKFLITQPILSHEIYTTSGVDFKILEKEDVIEIPAVTIKNHPKIPVAYQNIYEERFKYANIISTDPELIRTSWDIENALRRLIPNIKITLTAIYLRDGTSFFGKNTGVLFVVDGMPLYSDGWNYVKSISITDLSSITVLKGNQARTFYGLAAGGGVIFINTMWHDPSLNNTYSKRTSSQGNLLLPVNIYRANIEFYCPDKSDISNDPYIKKGSTYYWDPEVNFNDKESVKIKYLNLNHKGRVIITINGASIKNLVGTGKAGYNVN